MSFEPARGAWVAARLFPPGSPQALALLREAWALAVGPELARRTQVLSVDAIALRVAVPDARWRKVLHRMQGDILSRLRTVAGGLVPRRLGFIELATIEAAARPAPATPGHDAPTQATVCPPEVATAASAIADPELRACFVASAGRYLSRFRRASTNGGDHA